MELIQKTVLQFGEWLMKEGFSETIVKIFEGTLELLKYVAKLT